MSKFVSFVAGTLSFCLFVGMIMWGVQLSTFDPNQIPVIKRAAGPARMAPDDPGGLQASHQGLSVNEIQADGGATRAAEEVVLAPSPLDFQPEDVAGISTLKPKQASDGLKIEPKEMIAPIAVSAEASAKAAFKDQANAAIAKTKPKLEKAVEDVVAKIPNAEELKEEMVKTPEVTDLKTEMVAKPEPKPEVAEKAVAKVDTSIERPRSRPAKLRLASLKKTKPVEDKSLKAGTPLVQLGAYGSPETAAIEWANIQSKHSDLLGSKDYVVQKALSGGRTFYRLRVKGFGTTAEAGSFCAALKARGTDCIKATAR